MTTRMYVTEYNRVLNTMNLALHFKHITLSNRYGHVYSPAHTLSPSGAECSLSSLLCCTWHRFGNVKSGDMILFQKVFFFSNQWQIECDFYYNRKYCFDEKMFCSRICIYGYVCGWVCLRV